MFTFIQGFHKALAFRIFFSVDEDMDELEKELTALLEEPDVSPAVLPAVPTNRLGPTGEQILSSLPAAPRGPLNISTELLEEDLNRLTLSGLHVQISSFLPVFFRAAPNM